VTDPAPEELDLRGLLCPMPVIRTAERASALAPGALLLVCCTDPGVREDLPVWCRMHGHALEDIEEGGDEIRVWIRIGDPDRGSGAP
jgi:tRNA 2-thiouridine synthesizing protein A